MKRRRYSGWVRGASKVLAFFWPRGRAFKFICAHFEKTLIYYYYIFVLLHAMPFERRSLSRTKWARHGHYSTKNLA
jgi:hypothetical protein